MAVDGNGRCTTCGCKMVLDKLDGVQLYYMCVNGDCTDYQKSYAPDGTEYTTP